MRTLSNAGFTVIEMVVAIVLMAILMAAAAPFMVNLFASYTGSAEGADLASGAGPAVWQMQWDTRNAQSLNVTAACRLVLTQPNGTKIKYAYAGGQIIQILPTGATEAILAHVVVPGGGCPFVRQNTHLATYRFMYVGSQNQGQFLVEGALPVDD